MTPGVSQLTDRLDIGEGIYCSSRRRPAGSLVHQRRAVDAHEGEAEGGTRRPEVILVARPTGDRSDHSKGGILRPNLFSTGRRGGALSRPSQRRNNSPKPGLWLSSI